MNEQTLIDAINDLTRVTIASNFNGSQSDAVRRLHLAGVKQSRIASLLDMALKDVTSLVSKLRKIEKAPRKDSKRA
jgi:hypothetical protein